MADRNDAPMGVIQMILSGMPAWQKSILTLFMIAPLVLALSGMILQVNVGAIIQAIVSEQLTKSREQTVSAVKGDIVAQTKTVSDMLSQAISRMDALERRTDQNTRDINSIKVYICDTDAKTRGNCPLMR